MSKRLSIQKEKLHTLRITMGRPWRSGLEMAIIGMLSALVGYAVGALLKAVPLP